MRIIHTADWQIGKPFRNFGEKESVLRQARLAAIEAIGRLAQNEAAAHVLVAGDLYDNDAPSQKTLQEPVERMRAFPEISWHVIPGNHDYHRGNGLWDRVATLGLPPNLFLHLSPEPVMLGAEAVLLPAPLRRRSEVNDLTEWMDAAPSAPGLIRIGLAHGSVTGFGSEGEANNPIAPDRAKRAGLDYLALGDWHGTKEVGRAACYSGTPELDRFMRGDDHDPGNVLVVTAERGGAPQVTVVRTSAVGWHDLEFEFLAGLDTRHLAERVDARIGTRANRDLLRLHLNGSLNLTEMGALDGLLEGWQARLLRMKLTRDVALVPDESERRALTGRTSDPLIARVASTLLDRANGNDEASEIARIALRELHLRLHHPGRTP